MKKQYHILNGDALKEQLPKNIEGEIIVARECLVDGAVDGKTLDDLFETRAQFMATNYEDCTVEGYREKTVVEFQKMLQIEENAEINLWFEDDLFCQVNFWFVLHLLAETKKTYSLFLIRPLSQSQYGFGGLDKQELISVYKNKILLTNLEKLNLLWGFYQNNGSEELLKISENLEYKYPFLLPAVQAYIDSKPKNGDKGRPVESLTKIMKELKMNQFGPIFIEFCKRESIYGFGDLQVKRLFNELQNEKNVD